MNGEITTWYKHRVIELILNPPHRPHLKLCERAYQTLIYMINAMMASARLPKSFRMHSLEMASYICALGSSDRVIPMGYHFK